MCLIISSGTTFHYELVFPTESSLLVLRWEAIFIDILNCLSSVVRKIFCDGPAGKVYYFLLKFAPCKKKNFVTWTAHLNNCSFLHRKTILLVLSSYVMKKVPVTIILSKYDSVSVITVHFSFLELFFKNWISLRVRKQIYCFNILFKQIWTHVKGMVLSWICWWTNYVTKLK